jgi:hypothetical protein
MTTSVSGPDPTQAAQIQADSSAHVTSEQTAANRPSMYTPWGNMTWDQTAGKDAQGRDITNWTGHLGLNDTQQQSLDAQNQAQLGRSQMAEDLLGQTREQMMKPMETYDGREGADAMYGQMTSRLDPQWEQSSKALEQKLANQGLDPGSEAGNIYQGNFDRAKNDAYGSANREATQYGLQYAQGQQALQQAQRTGSLNLMNAAMSGEQVAQPNMPGFSQAGVSQGNQALQANQQAQQQAQMQNQMYGDIAGGVTSLAGSAMMFSDERLKTDIVRLPFEVLPGVPVATWKWADGSLGYGVIAQDLEKVRPDLVREVNGIKMVNYGGLQ